MVNNKGLGLVKSFLGALKEIKEDLYRGSVGAAGPSSEGCCHKPIEELERSREKYRRLAMQKIHHDQKKQN